MNTNEHDGKRGRPRVGPHERCPTCRGTGNIDPTKIDKRWMDVLRDVERMDEGTRDFFFGLMLFLEVRTTAGQIAERVRGGT